jgi:hypothetical protein
MPERRMAFFKWQYFLSLYTSTGEESQEREEGKEGQKGQGEVGISLSKKLLSLDLYAHRPLSLKLLVGSQAT